MGIFVHPWDMQLDGRMQQYWLPWLVGKYIGSNILVVPGSLVSTLGPTYWLLWLLGKYTGCTGYTEHTGCPRSYVLVALLKTKFCY